MRSADKAGLLAGVPHPEPPRVAGWRPLRHLGSGGSAEVWLVQASSGEGRFALKCPRRPEGEPSNPTAARREIRLMAHLGHEHLVRVHDVLPLGDTRGVKGEPAWGLLMDYAAGGSLAALVAVRRRLSVGETVTILTPLARVLGYLHSEGVVHGDISPGNVLFTAHGKPLLADLGIAGVLGDQGTERAGTQGFVDPDGYEPSEGRIHPQRDVYAAAALGWFCLTGRPPSLTPARPPLTLLAPDVPVELAAAIEAGLHPEAARRPSAAEFGHAVYRSARAEPLDLADAVDPSVLPQLLTRRHGAEPPSSRWQKFRQLQPRLRWPKAARRARRQDPGGAVRGHPGAHGTRSAVRLGAVVLAGTVLAAAAGAAWWSRSDAERVSTAAATDRTAAADGRQLGREPGQDGGEAEQPVPASVEADLSSPDPVQAARGLASLRAYALGTGRFDVLDQVNAPGSRAASEDRKLAEQLSGPESLFVGLSISLPDARTISAGQERAVVAATVTTSGYLEQRRSGQVVRAQPSSTEQRLQLVLVSRDGRWKLSEILAS